MYSYLYIFPCSAVVLSCLLLWRLAKNRLWAFYPYLTLFVGYRLLADIALFPINRYRRDWFPTAYWQLESVTLAMQFLVNWEFFRGLFSRHSSTKQIARTIVFAAELVVLPAIVLLSRSQTPLFRNLHFPLAHVVEQYVCLVQASLLLIPAAVAWYYRIPLNRNLRGLGFGLGVYLFVRAVNFASVQAFHGFAPYWRLLTPMTFIIMVAVWLWAFWNSAKVGINVNLADTIIYSWKIEWQSLWSRAILRVRRGTEQ